MSKDLTTNEAELARRAEDKAVTIRQMIREYNEAIHLADFCGPIEKLRKEREIERVVGEYIELYKALRRLRKKMRAGK